MRTLYTQLFSDFLSDNASTPEWTAIVTKFGTFPAFYIQGVRKSDGTYSDITLSSLYDLFVERYDMYEIGGETPDLFVHAVNDKLTELQIKYLPKMAILNQLVYAVDGTTHDSRAVSNTYVMRLEENYDNTGYVYPVNATSDKVSGRTNNNGYKETKMPLSQKSWTELIEEILRLPDLYNNLLDDLGTVFMQIL